MVTDLLPNPAPPAQPIIHTNAREHNMARSLPALFALAQFPLRFRKRPPCARAFRVR